MSERDAELTVDLRRHHADKPVKRVAAPQTQRRTRRATRSATGGDTLARTGVTVTLDEPTQSVRFRQDSLR